MPKMRTKRVIRKVVTTAKRTALAAVLCGMTAATTFAQGVELPKATIGPQGNPIYEYTLHQIQAQSTQPPATVPLQPRTLEPLQAPTPVPSPAPNQLNVDPNADIDDLVQPQPPPAAPTQAQDFNTNRQRGLGLTAGSFSSAPTMIGDFFGGAVSSFSGTITVPFTGYSPGTILSGGPGLSTSTLAFEFGTDIVPNDVFTTGLGSDLAGADGFADSFAIAEPLPPNDALTSPGPGFTFDGGTAVYTNNTTSTTPQPGLYTNGQQWYVSYSYSQAVGTTPGLGGRPAPGPGVSSRRVKLSENFSPEVRDRCFATYSFFNDAFGGLGDVSRYVVGGERVLWDELVSLEARLPMAGTYASTQSLDRAADRSFEFGNAALILKGILIRNRRLIWSAGLGIALPTADDTRIQSGGRNLLVVENETIHLLPFTALLLRKTQETAFQFYMQLDVATNGDPVYGDLTGTSLPKIGVFNDSALLHLDASLSHLLYDSQRSCGLRQLIANAELHYTGTLQESDFVQSGNLTFTSLARNFNIVNATAGMHFVLANNVVVTPAMSVPLSSGTDEQFDYEANIQVNLLR
jgi:hypothetical protein